MLCRTCLRAVSGSSILPRSLPISSDASALSLIQRRTLSRVAPRRSPSIATIPRSTQPSTPARTTTRPYSSASSPAAKVSSHDTSPPPLEKPPYLDEAESVVWDRLAAEFAPAELVVRDISGGCGSMYGIEIASDRFRGTTMLKQQRMVNAVLGDLMKSWHGVQLKTRAP